MLNRRVESCNSLIEYEASNKLSEEGLGPGPISMKDSGKQSHGFNVVGLRDRDHILEVVAIGLFVGSSFIRVVIRRFSSAFSASCSSGSKAPSEGFNDSSTDLPFYRSTGSKLVSSKRKGSISSRSIRWLGQFMSDLVLRGALCEGLHNSFYGHQ